MKNTPGFTTLTNTRHFINCRGILIDCSTPRVMGILNITPDSFYDGGKFTEEKGILEHVAQMASEGAAIIDIGAHSTRPGAEMIDEKTEAARLFPLLNRITAAFPEMVFSIDTHRAAIAEQALNAGVAMINDVSGGDLDAGMFNLAARHQVPYILMHMQGTPPTMQEAPQYDDVTANVFASIAEKINRLRIAGVHDIIIDPGFGFGKTLEQNFELLYNLEALQFFGCPLLVGISRKSMVCKTLKVNPKEALNGTTALHMIALLNGSRILRVHDVKEAMQTIALFQKYVSITH